MQQLLQAGGRQWSVFYIKIISQFMLMLTQAFSLNYFVDEEGMTVEDTKSTLKVYEDKKSSSGNLVKVYL